MLARSDIPNALCVMRMVLAVPTVIALIAGQFAIALLLVCVAGASDLLDGFLAKRCGWRSRIGGILDPLADKLFLVSLFITLGALGLIPAWLTGVVIGRDVVIVSGAVAYNFLIGPLQPEPSAASKFNTLAQLVFIVVVLLEHWPGLPLRPLVIVAGASVLVTSVISGLDYVIRWSARAAAAR